MKRLFSYHPPDHTHVLCRRAKLLIDEAYIYVANFRASL